MFQNSFSVLDWSFNRERKPKYLQKIFLKWCLCRLVAPDLEQFLHGGNYLFGKDTWSREKQKGRHYWRDRQIKGSFKSLGSCNSRNVVSTAQIRFGNLDLTASKPCIPSISCMSFPGKKSRQSENWNACNKTTPPFEHVKMFSLLIFRWCITFVKSWSSP